MNAKEFIKQQGFGDINSKQRPINIEIAIVAYLMEQYAEFKMQQANDAENSSDKCHIQNVNARAFVESCENLTEYVDGSKIAHRFKMFTIPVIEYNELRKAADDYDSQHVR